jgi:hypothetical protein
MDFGKELGHRGETIPQVEAAGAKATQRGCIIASTHERARSHSTIADPSRPCDLPLTKTPTWPPGNASSL